MGDWGNEIEINVTEVSTGCDYCICDLSANYTVGDLKESLAAETWRNAEDHILFHDSGEELSDDSKPLSYYLVEDGTHLILKY